jgi:hypothetical protein
MGYRVSKGLEEHAHGIVIVIRLSHVNGGEVGNLSPSNTTRITTRECRQIFERTCAGRQRWEVRGSHSFAISAGYRSEADADVFLKTEQTSTQERVRKLAKISGSATLDGGRFCGLRSRHMDGPW